MSALTGDRFGGVPLTDLKQIADARAWVYRESGEIAPLQQAEIDAGLTDDDLKVQIDAAARAS